MWVRKLFWDCDADSKRIIGYAGRWFWDKLDHEDLEFYWNECKDKHVMDMIKHECEVGGGIKIKSEGTIHGTDDGGLYNIDSYFLKMDLEVSMGMHSALYQENLPHPSINVLVVYKDLKRDFSYNRPKLVVDLICHEVRDVKFAAKRLNLLLEDRIKPNPRAVEQMGTKYWNVPAED